jgi:hypothetical protein
MMIRYEESRSKMTIFQAEMNFNAWSEDKVLPPGGELKSYAEYRVVAQLTKKGAKIARPY